MKKIQKIGFILTLVALSSVGCSSFFSPKVSSDLPSILENPISGKEVTLRGKIVGKMEECYIFTDGSNKILIHFKDEELSYNPDTMIMVNQFQVITAKE